MTARRAVGLISSSLTRSQNDHKMSCSAFQPMTPPALPTPLHFFLTFISSPSPYLPPSSSIAPTPDVLTSHPSSYFLFLHHRYCRYPPLPPSHPPLLPTYLSLISSSAIPLRRSLHPHSTLSPSPPSLLLTTTSSFVANNHLFHLHLFVSSPYLFPHLHLLLQYSPSRPSLLPLHCFLLISPPPLIET